MFFLSLKCLLTSKREFSFEAASKDKKKMKEKKKFFFDFVKQYNDWMKISLNERMFLERNGQH